MGHVFIDLDAVIRDVRAIDRLMEGEPGDGIHRMTAGVRSDSIDDLMRVLDDVEVSNHPLTVRFFLKRTRELLGTIRDEESQGILGSNRRVALRGIADVMLRTLVSPRPAAASNRPPAIGVTGDTSGGPQKKKLRTSRRRIPDTYARQAIVAYKSHRKAKNPEELKTWLRTWHELNAEAAGVSYGFDNLYKMVRPIFSGDE